MATRPRLYSKDRAKSQENGEGRNPTPVTRNATWADRNRANNHSNYNDLLILRHTLDSAVSPGHFVSF
jgi:hypothetical protein